MLEAQSELPEKEPTMFGVAFCIMSSVSQVTKQEKGPRAKQTVSTKARRWQSENTALMACCNR